MPKNKVKTPEINVPTNVGTLAYDLEVPTASDVVFKHTWSIQKYKRTIAKYEVMDSPSIRCAVNGFVSNWNLSIRFWKAANGKRVKNPIVLCLNLTGCEIEEPKQARIRFQFGIWDPTIKHWECCPVSRVVLNLETKEEILSVGYRDLNIRKTHIDSAGVVMLMIKIQVIQSEEGHCLSQDLARIFSRLDSKEGADLEIVSAGKENENILKAHSFIIRARSQILTNSMNDKKDTKQEDIKYTLDLSEHPTDLVTELIRYLYTDKVDNLEVNANRLLPIAVRYNIPGLVALCERSLLENLTPSSVPNILLLADQCNCEALRRAALSYCEDSEEIKENVQIGKTLAWKVMELVNPELFMEACESLGSSYGSNLDSPDSDQS